MGELIKDFGCKLFDNAKMKEKLPSPVYEKWIETINNNDKLDRTTADAIAHAMKEWAIQNGCTHYTHWFQPLTGYTAEKHDSFIDTKDGQVIEKFSGKNLIKGEADGSSFPSGGLRATFEARGYTYWDCTSPVFIKEGVLCIPTVFVSYTGEALDFKYPLLKSKEMFSKAATKLVNIFGDKKATSVTPVVGLEQEYFLVNKEDFIKRTDLVLSGRTLLGSLPPKGQELETHYYAAIPSRVKAFMNDVNRELWALGIYAKSEHNEVAPGQFELAPIFKDVNIAVDQNQLIMEILRKTALKHDLVCILSEKPFEGVNGSGKHNNFSFVTDTGINLFSPGKNPHENIQFLTFTCAFIKAVDEHQDIIRLFSSCPGNDYRLGANEAPPAIISIYLGEAVEQILNQIVLNKPSEFKKNKLKEFGINSLSYLPSDNSDRNRTSPIAFTGNKFEVRTLGSSMSASYLNICLNTIMTEAIEEISSMLENNKYRQDIRKAAIDVCASIIEKHNRILYSGDGYSDVWVKEAERRGLLNIKTFVEAVKYVEEHNSLDVFVKLGVFDKNEVSSRLEVFYENFYKTKAIEYKTVVNMLKTQIYPIVNDNIKAISGIETSYNKYVRESLLKFEDSSFEEIKSLEEVISSSLALESFKEKGLHLLNKGNAHFEALRNEYDSIEALLDERTLTYPKYKQLFFDLDF